MKKETTVKKPFRVGVVFGEDLLIPSKVNRNDSKALQIPALSYLITQLNQLQKTFEFEILPTLYDEPLLSLLNGKQGVDRHQAMDLTGNFFTNYSNEISASNSMYRLGENTCEHIMIITLAHFTDNYYSWTGEQVGIIALGNWEKRMAPPSLLETIITLLLSESALFLNKSYRQLYHFGTKGCVFDFNSSIDDIKLKTLQGFVCSHCRDLLNKGGHPDFADELNSILSKKWLGSLTDPSSPATIIAKLGYNMFVTKGLKPSFWETLQGTLQQDIPKQIINIIGAIILAVLLLYLGLKK